MPTREERFNLLRESNPEKYPNNFGKAWDDDETLELLQMIKRKETDETISKHFQRTPGGIRSRRKVLAAEYYLDNKLSIESIVKITGLTEDQVNDSINRRKAVDEKKTKKTQNKLRPKKVEDSNSHLLKSEVDIHLRIDLLFNILGRIEKKLDVLLITATPPPTAETDSQQA